MLYAFLISAVLITLAELGDKTQILVLALACRFKPLKVLAGMLLATLALFFIATLVGDLIGQLIPQFWLSVASGVLFLCFGVWTLKSGPVDEEAEAERPSRFGPVLTTALAFFLAELGDKTQIMAVAIAANPAGMLRSLGSFGPAVDRFFAGAGVTGGAIGPVQSFLGVWLGSTLGMMIADGAAILVGAVLGKALPEKLITRISGIVFVLFGLLALVAAFLGR